MELRTPTSIHFSNAIIPNLLLLQSREESVECAFDGETGDEHLGGNLLWTLKKAPLHRLLSSMTCTNLI